MSNVKELSVLIVIGAILDQITALHVSRKYCCEETCGTRG